MITLLLLFSLLSGEWEVYTNAGNIKDIVEKNGILYLATNGGVVAFDTLHRETLRLYTTTDGLPGVYVSSIGFSNGVLYAMTKDGLAYLEGDRFYPYPISIPLEGAGKLKVLGDYIFVASRSGFARIDTKGTPDPDDDEVYIFNRSNSPTLLSDTVVDFGFREDTIFVGTYGGINIIPPYGLFNPGLWDVLELPAGCDTVECLYVDESDVIVGGHNFLYWKKVGGEEVYTFPTYAIVKDIVKKSSNIAYVAILHPNRDGSGVYTVRYDVGPMPLFSGWGFFESYWITMGQTLYSSGSGLWIGFGYASYYANYIAEPSELSGVGLGYYDGDTLYIYKFSPLSTNRITHIVGWNGMVVVSSFRARSVEHSVVVLKNGEWVYPLEPYSIQGIEALKVSPWGLLYAGRRGMGIYVFDTTFACVDTYNFPSPNAVSAVGFTPDSNILAGVYENGTFIVNRETGEVSTFLTAITNPSTISCDGAQNVWIGGYSDGCLIYDYDTGEIEYLKREDGLPSDMILTLKPSGDGMWIGTGAGLAYYENGNLKVFLNNDPLYGSPAIKDIEFAPDGKLWLLTNIGVLVFNPEEGRVEFRLSSPDYPLPGNTSDDWVKEALLFYNGKVYIGTYGGLAVFEPSLHYNVAGEEGPYLYPNPLRNGGNVYIARAGKDSKVELFTISLEKINVDVRERGEVKYFDASNLAPGLYIIRITQGGKTHMLKLSVVK